MKKFILPLLTFAVISIFTRQAAAQDSTAVAKAPVIVVDSSLKGQYELLLAKSKTINTYKLINPYRLSAFYKSVTDSIRAERSGHKKAATQIAGQAKEIASLNDQIKGKESSLASSNSKVNEISFIGIPFSKGAYNTMVWTIIIVLALALTFVTVRSAKSIHEAKYRSGLYEEISQEYQAYKVKANEKEKKLARELQDERNKIDELKNRGI